MEATGGRPVVSVSPQASIKLKETLSGDQSRGKFLRLVFQGFG